MDVIMRTRYIVIIGILVGLILLGSLCTGLLGGSLDSSSGTGTEPSPVASEPVS